MGKILVYSPDAGTRLGHPFMYATRICQCLAKKGATVTLFTTSGFAKKYHAVYGEGPTFAVKEKSVAKQRSEQDIAKLSRRTTTLQMIRYMWYRISSNMAMLRELRKLLATDEFDILHWIDNPEMLTTLSFGLLFRLSVHSQKAPRWFLNIHPGDLAFRTGGRHPLRRLYKGFSGWALKFMLRRGFVTAIFVHGERIRNNLLSAWNLDDLKSKVIVAPYGIDDPPVTKPSRQQARQNLGIPEKGFVVLSFGMIRKDKRIDDIIKAVAHVPDAILVVAGMPVDVNEQEIRRRIAQAGIAERAVLYLQYIPENQMSVFFTAADVVVLAHDQGFPGQSGPLHLACSYLVPVIASDVGDIGRFVREHKIGEVFPPRNWQALAKLLAYFKGMGKAEYQEYVERERATAEKLRWENTAERYLETYAS